jgi:uncharacterized protein (TIGR02145 family)
MKTLITSSLLLLITSFLFAQAPQGIPYQAVLRNADGSVMANSAADMTFMIHDGSATGTVVYQESHALTSNTQGLVSCVVGNGVVSQGNFANIDWGSGAKFLHVMMGTTDLGTQRMLSVPYALYSNGVGVSVSETGDTLTIGGNSVIVPGISAANANNNIPTSGLGAVVLPGNNTCADQFINVVGCNGQTSLTYDGRTYDLVEIGGQCWFADNLATDQYRNGDYIPTGLDNEIWIPTTSGAYSIYNDDSTNDSIYGKLYNWYTTVDTRGLCPSGWHVPTDCEWMYLEGSLGMSIIDQQKYGFRETNIGGQLKAPILWNSPNVGANNSSGFTALPGGSRYDILNYGYGIGFTGAWWSSSEDNSIEAWIRILYNDSSTEIRTRENDGLKFYGYSIRCLKDSESAPIQGCTDGAACNFLANANEDDGSCLYQNATCDDGNVNTMNDVIGGNCICSGGVMLNGCTNAQACNYNAAATEDDGSCLIQGASCNDGNANTINDVINANCQCEGTATGNGVFVPGNGVTDIDGTVYTSIVINGQEWMQQNLAVTKYRNGDPIPTGLSDATWSNTTSGAFAIYNNDAANNTTYGKLYNWYAVNDSRGLCPTGWHVPSDGEWTTLETSLGGSSVAGGKMKSTGTIENGDGLWHSPNEQANESGFTGLPSGYRFIFGTYNYIGEVGFWWSDTEYDSTYAWNRELVGPADNNIYRLSNGKWNGFSVRCVKD